MARNAPIDRDLALPPRTQSPCPWCRIGRCHAYHEAPQVASRDEIEAAAAARTH